ACYLPLFLCASAAAQLLSFAVCYKVWKLMTSELSRMPLDELGAGLSAAGHLEMEPPRVSRGGLADTRGGLDGRRSSAEASPMVPFQGRRCAALRGAGQSLCGAARSARVGASQSGAAEAVYAAALSLPLPVEKKQKGARGRAPAGRARQSLGQRAGGAHEAPAAPAPAEHQDGQARTEDGQSPLPAGALRRWGGPRRQQRSDGAVRPSGRNPPLARARRQAGRRGPGVGSARRLSRRAPHAVLGVPASASVRAIKAAFRARAKECHPDSNPSPEAADQMVELLAAYDALLDGDLSDRARGSRVAHSCEAFTVEELAADGKHDVHAFRIVLATSVLEWPEAFARQ
ncbi:unnamed protein product, partial [Prorocentrum cordatum]